MDVLASTVELAASLGYNGLFTSLQLPESDPKQVMEDFPKLTALAARYHMQVNVDVSPRTFEMLGIPDKYDMRALRNLGIDVARLDWGYDESEIARLTHNDAGVYIEINASSNAFNRAFLDRIAEAGADFKRMRSCHNFYPKARTGLNPEYVGAANRLSHEYGIETGAFIASRYHHRHVAGDGLPTIERHRYMDPVASAKELYLLKTDNIYFGDDFACKEELTAVKEIRSDIIELRVDPLPCCKQETKWLFSQDSMHMIHQEIPHLIRCSKRYPGVPEPFHNIERKDGDITLDNGTYTRYHGELNIVRGDMPADNRVNVIGRIVEEERFLTQYLKSGISFRFICNK